MKCAKLIRVILFALLNGVVFFHPADAPASDTQTVTVQVTPEPVNTFVAARALGAGVDGLDAGEVAQVYTPGNLRAMRSAGLGALTYRLRTELAVEAWHWNPQGQWSEGKGRAEGYWTSAATAGQPLGVCNGYRLPRRGGTVDQANNDGYSRLDDGDSKTFWKSNPYLDRRFTAEDNAAHPQWVVIKLDRPRPINAVRIAWAALYAVEYAVQYWSGGAGGPDRDSLSATFGEGAWKTFAGGRVTAGRGGTMTLRLQAGPRPVRFLRLWMTRASGIAPMGAHDVRDGLGYAIRELGAGTVDARGRFHDQVRHAADGKKQTVMFVSSTDPWHRASDRDPSVEQPGLDRVFKSGLTRGLPLLASCGLLYDTPENAAALLRFLRARGYRVRGIELGEEPDGQYVTPEDYGALYVQWADALHHVDPTLTLGGPSFQTAVGGWVAWLDARGDRSWLRRFLRYLSRRGRLADFGFFSFEWYPFDNVSADNARQLAAAPMLLEGALARLRREGLPRRTPWLITEYGYSSFAGRAEMDWPGALLNAETPAQFLTLGGQAAFLYGYEPAAPMREPESGGSWGNLALLLSGDDRQARAPLATYYAARLLTRAWAEPDTTMPQALYRVEVARRAPVVTAYALHRPDGRWAVLLLNKDPKHTALVAVEFRRPETTRAPSFSGPTDLYQYSSAQYVWHPRGAHGFPTPDAPPAHSRVSGRMVRLPPYSLSVLCGRVVGLGLTTGTLSRYNGRRSSPLIPSREAGKAASPRIRPRPGVAPSLVRLSPRLTPEAPAWLPKPKPPPTHTCKPPPL